MSTVTIPKKTYQDLVSKALRYEYLREAMESDLFSSPPTRSRKKILRAFKATKKHAPAFLKSLERGLKRSSYFVS
ncbi:MAG: hypothetical protein Q8P01_02185 [bacterium]|nr:hypothetical protein [bacterium]